MLHLRKRSPLSHNASGYHFKLITFCLWAGLTIQFGCKKPASYQTIISIQGNQWYFNDRVINEGSPAEGLMMNVRMVNAVFEDHSRQVFEHDPDFDAETNTGRFIDMIPLYAASGVNAFTVSLQGGMPGYEGAVNTAFNADGTLRQDYMQRIFRIIEAADAHGAAVILTCFYQRQHSHDRALQGQQAIKNAVVNVVKWIAENSFTNVLVEISNEYAHSGYSKWADGEWLRSVAGQVELIRLAKETAPALPISTSGMGNGLIAPEIAETADYILIHFNNTALADIPDRVAQSTGYGKPLICNEDDKTGYVGAQAALQSVTAGAGWGFMHSGKNQHAPFEYAGAGDDTIVYHMLSRLTSPGDLQDISAVEESTILITEPKDGDVFPVDNHIEIKAVITGIDSDTNMGVYYFAGDSLIGRRETAPWTYVWSHPPAGKHDLVAIAKDGHGRELARSRGVDIEVQNK